MTRLIAALLTMLSLLSSQASAAMQDAPLVNVGDTFVLCAELEHWSERVAALYEQLYAKHTEANTATGDCSTDDALETIRTLFSQAIALFEDLFDEVQALDDCLGEYDAGDILLADAVRQTHTMYANYQTGVQYMYDMTYAHAEENVSQALALGETGAGYCNEAMTVDDVLLAIYNTVSTALCQGPKIELLSPAMDSSVEGPVVFFAWRMRAVGQAGYTLAIRQLPNSDFVDEIVEVRSLYDIPESFFDVEYEIIIPGVAEVSPAATEYAMELEPGASYVWQVFSFLDEERIAQSEVGAFTCTTAPPNVDLGLSERVPSGCGDLTFLLVSPANGESLDIDSGKLTWTPVDTPDTTYTVTISPLVLYIEEQARSYDFLEANPAPFADSVASSLVHVESNIGTASINLSDLDSPLVPGLTYVWQITVHADDGLVEARSEVWAFEAVEEQAPSSAAEAATDEDEGPPCGEECANAETACGEPITRDMKLEWRDVILDDDFPADEVLANQSHSVSIRMSPRTCIPWVHDKCNSDGSTASRRKEDGTVFQVTPSSTDHDPQEDDSYVTRTLAVYSGACVAVLNYTFYCDSPMPEDAALREGVTRLIHDWIGLLHLAALAPWTASEPLQQPGSSKFDLAKRSQEKVETQYAGIFAVEDEEIDKAAERVKAENPHLRKYIDAWATLVRTLKACECGYVATMWEICGTYVPCNSCDATVKSSTISLLGDTDHHAARNWSLNSETGQHDNQGEDF